MNHVRSWLGLKSAVHLLRTLFGSRIHLLILIRLQNVANRFYQAVQGPILGQRPIDLQYDGHKLSTRAVGGCALAHCRV